MFDMDMVVTDSVVFAVCVKGGVMFKETDLRPVVREGRFLLLKELLVEDIDGKSAQTEVSGSGG